MRDPARVRVAGPLERFAEGFATELSRQGYTANSAALQLGLMAHASRWLAAQGRDAALDAAAVDAFLAARRVAGYASLVTGRAMAPLLGFLRGVGAAPAAVAPVAGTPAEVLLERYRRYLLVERGLAAGTDVCRFRPAERWLMCVCQPGSFAPSSPTQRRRSWALDATGCTSVAGLS